MLAERAQLIIIWLLWILLQWTESSGCLARSGGAGVNLRNRDIDFHTCRIYLSALDHLQSLTLRPSFLGLSPFPCPPSSFPVSLQVWLALNLHNLPASAPAVLEPRVCTVITLGPILTGAMKPQCIYLSAKNVNSFFTFTGHLHFFIYWQRCFTFWSFLLILRMFICVCCIYVHTYVAWHVYGGQRTTRGGWFSFPSLGSINPAQGARLERKLLFPSELSWQPRFLY